MNKKSIDRYISKVDEMSQKLIEVRNHLEFRKTTCLSEYSNPVDKDQAREANESLENEIMWSLWEVSQDAKDIIKKIDPETLKEFEDA
jgi:hypothetical protein